MSCRRANLAAISSGSRGRSLVPVDLLAALVALLRLDRQRGDRPCVEALQPDRLARLFAITIGAVFDALQGGVDLGDQLALPVAGAKLDGTVCFGGCTVGEVGMVGALFGEVVKGLARFPEDFILPVDQLGRK